MATPEEDAVACILCQEVSPRDVMEKFPNNDVFYHQACISDSAEQNPEERDQCLICHQRDYIYNLVSLSCSHRYHPGCLKPWWDEKAERCRLNDHVPGGLMNILDGLLGPLGPLGVDWADVSAEIPGGGGDNVIDMPLAQPQIAQALQQQVQIEQQQNQALQQLLESRIRGFQPSCCYCNKDTLSLTWICRCKVSHEEANTNNTRKLDWTAGLAAATAAIEKQECNSCRRKKTFLKLWGGVPRFSMRNVLDDNVNNAHYSSMCLQRLGRTPISRTVPFEEFIASCKPGTLAFEMDHCHQLEFHGSTLPCPKVNPSHSMMPYWDIAQEIAKMQSKMAKFNMCCIVAAQQKAPSLLDEEAWKDMKPDDFIKEFHQSFGKLWDKIAAVQDALKTSAGKESGNDFDGERGAWLLSDAMPLDEYDKHKDGVGEVVDQSHEDDF